jgi:hypothetical protein
MQDAGALPSIRRRMGLHRQGGKAQGALGRTHIPPSLPRPAAGSELLCADAQAVAGEHQAVHHQDQR